MNVRMMHRWGGAVLTGGLFLGALGALAQDTSSTVPDAQIESNVLKALASAPELSTQNIQSSTVYGTVTLTGNVQDEALRTTAENLVARALGVKKVVDELTLGDTPPQANDQAGQPDENGASPNGQPGMDQPGAGQPEAGQNNQMVLQSDGTYAPAQNNAEPPPEGQQMQNSGVPPPPPEGYQAQQGDQGSQGEQGPPPPGRQPMDQGYGQQPNQAPIPGGQQAGIAVTVPPGSMLRIRINRGLDSNHIRADAPFDGTVLTDVVAGGAVAIPRGATVSGVVVGAKKAGVFKGEGELSLQVNSVMLGGQEYPLTTDVWASTGQNKTPGTVGNTVGLSAFGAIVGAIAGGGTGAAIGAGVGAGAGLAGSAGSPRGQIIIPPESVLTFRTAAPATVRTVSEREMERLSYQAGPSQQNGPRRVRYYSPYYGYYYGPPQ
ncbi:MAG: BON domain-containing protein [Acidobacteriaceae bacterium]